jgi:putative FmdB family regulatory protein
VPTYQYVCTECGSQVEALQKFSDDPLTEHDACGGRLRKVFSPVGIVFKGSGFYRNDSRSGAKATGAAESSSSESSSSGKPAEAAKVGAEAAAPAEKTPASSPSAPSPSAGKSAEKVA